MKYLFLLLLLLFGCQKTDPPTESYNLVLEQLQQNNLLNIRKIDIKVEEKGNRKFDLAVVNPLKELVKLKESYSIPVRVDPISEKMMVAIGSYSKELGVILEENGFDSKNTYLTYAAINKRIETEKHNPYAVLSDLLLLEGEFIRYQSRKVGVNSGFCFTLNFNRKSDTIRVGERFDFVLSLAEPLSSFSQVRIESQVKYSGNIVKVQFTDMGGALFGSFIPSDSGIYNIKTNVYVRQTGIEIEFPCNESHFVVATN